MDAVALALRSAVLSSAVLSSALPAWRRPRG